MTTEQSAAPAARAGALGELADQLFDLNAERARLLDRTLAAERAYVQAIADALEAERITWWDVVEAYDLVRSSGITGFSKRWFELIPYDRPHMVRLAQAMPRTDDGVWRGSTGWPIEGDVYPAKHTMVVYVLFSPAGHALHVGVTEQFRAHLKRQHMAGREWARWEAHPVKSRRDGLALRKELQRRYAEGNVATHPAG